MNALPVWIQVLQALMVPTVALFAGVIAFMQWRTAHQKVLLDLFDRRLRVYSKTSDFRRTVRLNGEELTLSKVAEFHRVREEAAFLFGNDIKSLLQDFHNEAIDASGYLDAMKTAGPRERAEYGRRAFQHIKTATEMSKDLEAKFAPYMRMDQKRVRTFFELIEERNTLRLSYADEKQRSQ